MVTAVIGQKAATIAKELRGSTGDRDDSTTQISALLPLLPYVQLPPNRCDGIGLRPQRECRSTAKHRPHHVRRHGLQRHWLLWRRNSNANARSAGRGRRATDAVL